MFALVPIFVDFSSYVNDVTLFEAQFPASKCKLVKSLSQTQWKKNICFLIYLADWPWKLYNARATVRGSNGDFGDASGPKSSYRFRAIGDFCDGVKLSVWRRLVMSCISCKYFRRRSSWYSFFICSAWRYASSDSDSGSLYSNRTGVL